MFGNHGQVDATGVVICNRSGDHGRRLPGKPGKRVVVLITVLPVLFDVSIVMLRPMPSGTAWRDEADIRDDVAEGVLAVDSDVYAPLTPLILVRRTAVVGKCAPGCRCPTTVELVRLIFAPRVRSTPS